MTVCNAGRYGSGVTEDGSPRPGSGGLVPVGTKGVWFEWGAGWPWIWSWQYPCILLKLAQPWKLQYSSFNGFKRLFVLMTGNRAVVVVLAGLMLPNDGKHGEVAMADEMFDRMMAGLQLLRC